MGACLESWFRRAHRLARLGQVEIKNYKIRRALAGSTQGGCPVAGRVHLVPCQLQASIHHFQQFWLVIHNKHCGHIAQNEPGRFFILGN